MIPKLFQSDDFLIFDLHNIAWKSIRAGANLTTKAGKPSGHIYLSLRIILKWRKQYPGTLVFADEGGNEIKLAIDPGYKANRDDDRGFDPIPDMRRLISLMRCKHIFIKGNEADNAAAAFILANEGSKVLISNDTDFWQLRDKCTIIKDNQIVDDDVVAKKFNGHVLTPEQVILWKSVIGDPGDNVPRAFGHKLAKLVDAVIRLEPLSVLNKEGVLNKFVSLLDPVPTPEEIERFRKNWELVDLLNPDPEDLLQTIDIPGNEEGLYNMVVNEFECKSLKGKLDMLLKE